MINNYNKLTIVLISFKSEKKIYDFVKRIPKEIKTIIIENSNNIQLKKNIEKKNKNIKVYIKKNEGVSSSINYAVKKIKTEYFIQISPDILFDYKKLAIFFKVAKKLNDRFAALGPRFMKVNKKSHKQIKEELDVGTIKAVHGSCMFINKKRFNQIGGFDKNFFLYFEETDYCRRGLSKNLKSYQINKIKVKSRGRSVSIKSKIEQRKLANILIWHFIWSKFYFTKKKYGTLLSIVIFLPIIIRAVIKIWIYKLIDDKQSVEKYRYRLNGLIRSIKGKRSSLRP